MTDPAKILRRSLIWTSYCLPLLFALVLTVWYDIPNMWFVYDGTAHETMSLFDLLGYTWNVCGKALSAESIDTATYHFANLMRGNVILFWVLFALYWFFAAGCAACSAIAFSCQPTVRTSNRTKRILHLFCPNRVCFLIGCSLPILPALFPHILLLCYQNILGMTMRVGFEPFADWIVALIALLLPSVLFLVTLPWQKEEHLDMFRIYKSGKQVAGKGEEAI